MWNVLVAFLATTSPKILPLPVMHGKIMVNTWVKENRDCHALKRSKQVYDGFKRKYERPDSNMRCIAVLNQDRIGAIALMEKVESTIVLWDLSINDETSGSTLMKVVCTTTPSLKIASTVNDRWKIASLYFRTFS